LYAYAFDPYSAGGHAVRHNDVGGAEQQLSEQQQQ
jgi:hypothetical protein